MSRLNSVLRLVQVSSVSRDESVLADLIENQLRGCAGLEVIRIANNVVARTSGEGERVILAGHLDTVPGNAADASIRDGILHGVGACDMKASLAVMLEVAERATEANRELTFIFYAKEEIARSESGLLEIAAVRPDLLTGDFAVLGEPTGDAIEAGCQGSLRIAITLTGVRAHTARPFTGRNAIHRLGQLISHIADYSPRIAEVDGITFTEQLQVVQVGGGLASNVVPDEASLTVNFRFAPDRNGDEAEKWLRGYVAEHLESTDMFEVLDSAPSAKTALENPALRKLIDKAGVDVRGKVGWTDVATFAELGIPATNFGAGDPLLAHRSDECVTEGEVERYATTLLGWLFD